MNEDIEMMDGKNILVYKPRGAKSYSKNDIISIIKKYKLNEFLKFLGELSFKILSSNQVFLKYQGVPISESILAYIAMVAIENSNDYRKESITIDNLIKIIDMYFGLPDPFLEDNDIDALLLRVGSAQFDYNREINNLLARTYLIYCKLWGTVDEARDVDLKSTISEISGLKIEDILVICFAYFGASKDGFFRVYSQNKIKNKIATNICTDKNQANFLKWIACSYEQFRSASSVMKSKMPDPTYEKNRFNLLVKHPIIIPDCNPKPNLPQVYLVPIPRLLLERVTRGLYFDFSDYYQFPGKDNKFREAFGHVFQQYVGHLLNHSPIKVNLVPEKKYAKGQKSTADWILLEDNRAIFIEVKQSGLFLQAKTMGEIEEVRDNLNKTISKAILQLWLFEKDVKSGKYVDLKFLSSIEKVERLIVTYDRTYYSNSILIQESLNLAKSKDDSIPLDYYCHIISIEEFEYFLGITDLSLFELLNNKRKDSSVRSYDFREYRAKLFSKTQFYNPYLESIKNEFLSFVDADTKTA